MVLYVFKKVKLPWPWAKYMYFRCISVLSNGNGTCLVSEKNIFEREKSKLLALDSRVFLGN
jgi:hypothetical protein